MDEAAERERRGLSLIRENAATAAVIESCGAGGAEAVIGRRPAGSKHFDWDTVWMSHTLFKFFFSFSSSDHISIISLALS